MNDKLLSIVVLNWNRKDFSQKTIENVIQKTTVRNEIILVDNYSAQAGIRDYLLSVKGNDKTERIEHVFNSRNLGTGGGRNSGLARAKGDYLVNLDDDILVPDNYDTLMMEVCDKVPRLGITGVNVETVDYPEQVINGIRCRPKIGNLGEACTCMSRKIFNIVGFNNCFNTYGHEGAAMYMRLKQIGLISAYIVPCGVHFDTNSDKAYRKAKDKAFEKDSNQMKEFYKCVNTVMRTGNVYVPWDENFSCADQSIFTNDLILNGRK
jgi:glycosyltransferase involved in cell wall biosynthesis